MTKWEKLNADTVTFLDKYAPKDSNGRKEFIKALTDLNQQMADILKEVLGLK